MKDALKRLGILAKDCLFLELLLPMSPFFIEFLLRKAFPVLGPFASFEKSLVTSGMMVPLVLYIRTEGWISKLLGFVFAAGAVFFALIVCIDTIAQPSVKPAFQSTCCWLSIVGLSFTGILRLIAEAVRIHRQP